MPKKEDTGLKQNLVNQVRSFFKQNNEGAYGTDDRYLEGCLRFARFLGETTHLQKMTNAEARHLYAYVDYMKNRGLAPSTVMTDLSAIRFYYERNGSKNKMPENVKLNLEKREVGVLDKSWLPVEIERCYQLAEFKGRTDVVIAMDFMLHFGLRINEAASLKVSYLMRALNCGQLLIIGKGARPRVISFEKGSTQEAILKKWLTYAQDCGKYHKDFLLCDRKHRDVEKEKKSMQNWLSRAKKQILVADREMIYEDGKKPRKDTISFHGLRHTFAQRYFVELDYMSEKDAKLEVSEALGHGRIEVTRIYLS